MSKRREIDEIVDLITDMHAAQTNALLTLVKTLEEAGAIQAEHYEANLRMFAEAFAAKSGPAVTQLMLDLADQVSRQEPEGNA